MPVFLKAMKEAIGKTCGWKAWTFPQGLCVHFQETWPRSTLVRATRGNTVHNPDISESLSLSTTIDVPGQQ